MRGRGGRVLMTNCYQYTPVMGGVIDNVGINNESVIDNFAINNEGVIDKVLSIIINLQKYITINSMILWP